MSYENLNNQDPENINNQEKAQYPIDEVNKILDRGNDFWKHLSEFAYANQLSLAKNYQWLCVTFITGLIAIYAEFVKPLDLNSPQIWIINCGLMIYIVAWCCALIGLMLGIFILSSSWFSKTYEAPLQIDKCEDMVKRVKYHSKNSDEYYENLKRWAGWFDSSIDSFITLANQRGKFLRAQCYLTLISLICSVLSLILFLAN